MVSPLFVVFVGYQSFFFSFRHTTVIFQGTSQFRTKFGVSKALTSLQIIVESFGLVLLQAYIVINTWTSYYSMPIAGLANIGLFELSGRIRDESTCIFRLQLLASNVWEHGRRVLGERLL